MKSGAWTGKIQRLEGKQGSDLKAVDWNQLEKPLLTYLVVDDSGGLGPHLGLLARAHDLGLLTAWPSHGCQISHMGAQGSGGKHRSRKGGSCIAYSDPALKIHAESLFYYI